MKALMVMYDSLRRDLLSVYGGPIPAPNFERLAAHTVCFDKSYVGSLPCMPARRELHTGRYNFLHRSWGPMEPYDDSMPEILKKQPARCVKCAAMAAGRTCTTASACIVKMTSR